MQTEQIDEIREMFRNDDGTCKLSRSDVLLIVDKLVEQQRQSEESPRGMVWKSDQELPSGV